jgi:hypothetical protein
LSSTLCLFELIQARDESPPSSGRFFWQGDSGLYRPMLATFRGVDRSIDDQEFLVRFLSANCYLIDTCSQPVDQLDPQTRRAGCITSRALLARAIAELRSAAMATLPCALHPRESQGAALRSGWSGQILDLRYRGMVASPNRIPE